MNNPLTLLPPMVRKYLYAAYGVVGLVVACVDVYFGASDPSWVQPTQDVLAYLAVPMGVLAASNTPASAAEVAEVVAEAQTPVEDPDGDDLDGDPFEYEDVDPAANDGLPQEPGNHLGVKDIYGKDARG